MSFLFTSRGGGGAAPDDQLYQDIMNLDGLSTEQLEELVTMVFQFFTASKGSGFVEELEDFAGRHQVKMGALKNTCRGFMQFVTGAARAALTPAQVQQDLLLFGLREECASAVAALWKEHFVALSRSMAGKTFAVNELLDVEWKFGVTASNDELRQVGSSFLQLKLVLDKGGGNRETVRMEMSLSQFYQFLSEMEKAKSWLSA